MRIWGLRRKDFGLKDLGQPGVSECHNSLFNFDAKPREFIIGRAVVSLKGHPCRYITSVGSPIRLLLAGCIPWAWKFKPNLILVTRSVWSIYTECRINPTET